MMMIYVRDYEIESFLERHQGSKSVGRAHLPWSSRWKCMALRMPTANPKVPRVQQLFPQPNGNVKHWKVPSIYPIDSSTPAAQCRILSGRWVVGIRSNVERPGKESETATVPRCHHTSWYVQSIMICAKIAKNRIHETGWNRTILGKPTGTILTNGPTILNRIPTDWQMPPPWPVPAPSDVRIHCDWCSPRWSPGRAATGASGDGNGLLFHVGNRWFYRRYTDTIWHPNMTCIAIWIYIDNIIYRFVQKQPISKSGFRLIIFSTLPFLIAILITSTGVHWASRQMLTLAPQEALWHMLQGTEDTRSSQGGVHLWDCHCGLCGHSDLFSHFFLPFGTLGERLGKQRFFPIWHDITVKAYNHVHFDLWVVLCLLHLPLKWDEL